jgi:enamine deaminase RidA (YjgF/YER057c/UK114 family)
LANAGFRRPIVRTPLNPSGVNPPRGNYVQAVVVTAPTLVFASGQVAMDEHNNVVGKGDIEAQARQVFHNLQVVLEAAGSSLHDIVMWTIYDTDIGAHAETLNRVGREAMGQGGFPASTKVGVTRLSHPDYLLEIDAVAIVRNAPQGA